MISTAQIGNKFEFITVAGERCRQLQRGARPRIGTLTRPAGAVGGRRAGPPAGGPAPL
ncbi:MAG: hypothetical protein AAB249_04905 [Acidobacteriota bacterium]